MSAVNEKLDRRAYLRPKAVDNRKILLVGELNPYGADPEFALFPLPKYASGGRLREILGLSTRDYLLGHDRVNLCTGTWSRKAAREKAREILVERRTPEGVPIVGKGLVLLGRRVIDSFCEPGGLQVNPLECVMFGGVHAALLPHPSGRNQLWNDPQTAVRARACYDQLRRTVGYELQIPRGGE